MHDMKSTESIKCYIGQKEDNTSYLHCYNELIALCVYVHVCVCVCTCLYV